MKIAVIGAGITGLCAAYALKKQGHTVSIFEKQSKAGGVLQSFFTQEGYLIETGAVTLNVKDPIIEDFLTELQLQKHIVQKPSSLKKRFILKNDRLHPLPLNPIQLIFSKLFSSRAKLKIISEWFMTPRTPAEDESIASFFMRHFGQEVVDYLVDPFISGIYAGNIETLSSRAVFPTLYQLEKTIRFSFKGFSKRKKKIKSKIISFSQGIATLIDAISSKLKNELFLNHELISVKRIDDDFEVKIKTNSGEKESFDSIILTIPAYTLPEIEFAIEGEPSLKAIAQHIDYVPLSLVHLAYDRKLIEHPLDGFGFLIPSIEKYNILGALFRSTLYPIMHPPGQALLTVFVGGANTEHTTRQSDSQLISIAAESLRSILNINAVPNWSYLVRWKHAIPQYTIGHHQKIDILKEIESRNKGLHFIGTYSSGIALPDCIKTGLNVVSKF